MDFKDTTQNDSTRSGSSLIEATVKINQDAKEKSLQEISKDSNGKFGYIDIARTPINPDLHYLVDYSKLRDSKAVPFFRLGMKLRLAVANPNEPALSGLLEELSSKGFEIQLNLASEEGVLSALSIFENAQLKNKPTVESTVNIDELEAYQKEIENLGKLTEKISLSSAKDGLTLLQLGAIKTGASDIHFQPEENEALIRFRIDGVLQNVSNISREIYNQLSQQIKYEAGMKLNVNHIPQDGRISFMVNDRKIDVRVSTIPTEFGETIVMRILDSGKKFATFEELGFSEDHLKILNQVSNLSQGMILVTGPTGSGKTTSLYSMLSLYNSPERKIITLEDPIEYHLKQIVQSQINEKKGYTFVKGLESILRQDPDVVMIGEIRDLETANTALQAALTGHVMLSTLHTNSALETIPRLMNMGLDEFMIAPALDTLMAQRLVRKFCPHCSKSEKISDSDKAYIETHLTEINAVKKLELSIPDSLNVAVGCEKCNHTGYLGRIVIAEIYRVDDEFKELIMQKKSVLELNTYAIKKGMLNMEQDGVIKVLNGQTSISELKRVTS